MKKSPKLFMLLLLFAFVINCSTNDDTDSDNISNQTLQGNVFGTDFMAVGGKAFASGDDLSINITDINADCSSLIYDYNLYMSTYVPLEIGIYDVNVVFNIEDELPHNYTKGTVEVTAISDTEVTVKILANSSANNSVEGTFTVPICD